jgi:hypothetical protein
MYDEGVEDEEGLEINTELVVSTAHIPGSTNAYLKSNPSLLAVYENEYGYRIYVPRENEIYGAVQALMECGNCELAKLIRLAQVNKCKWLVLDCDGPDVKGFKRFDW